MSNRVFMIVILLAISFQSRAEVTLPSIFTNGMVLQQSSSTKFWGEAKSGEAITIETSWGKKISTVADGSGEWQALVPTPKGSFTRQSISITGENHISIEDLLIGEVWFCSGQSNMGWSVGRSDNGETEIANANYKNIRIFSVPNVMSWKSEFNTDAEWVSCSPETIAKQSGVAYFFGRNLYQELNVPIGLVVSALGGSNAEAWLNREQTDRSELSYISKWYDKHEEEIKERRTAYMADLAAWKSENKEASNSSPKPQRYGLQDNRIPFALYNGMVHPVEGYSIKGAIWYQGEANVPNADDYNRLFPGLVKGWREVWNQGEFPFYYVQIAPFHYRDSLGVKSAELRDAQLKTLDRLPNVGMVVVSDISTADNIHPRNKQEVGKRLARLALKNDYKVISEEVNSPLYRSHKIKGSKVIINIKSAKKLVCKGQEIIGFTIADENRNFVKAEAKIINKSQIEVWSDKIANPKSVRCGWINTAQTNLFNEVGLPISPFKTDEWDNTTKGNIYPNFPKKSSK